MNCKEYQQILIYHTDFLPRLDDIQGVFLRNGEGRITYNNIDALTELVMLSTSQAFQTVGRHEKLAVVVWKIAFLKIERKIAMLLKVTFAHKLQAPWDAPWRAVCIVSPQTFPKIPWRS
jgi:hypothetical protein